MPGAGLILTALGEELRPATARFREMRSESIGGLETYRGRFSGGEVIAASTGVGPEAAAAAVRALVFAEQPSWILFAGFGGALDGDLEPGDTVLGVEVLDAETLRGEDGRYPSRDPVRAPPHLLAAALRAVGTLRGRLPGRIREGRIASVRAVSSSAVEKARLRDASGASAVDMESAGATEEAARSRTPILCVRAILDEAAFDIPIDFGKLISPEGRPRTLRLLALAARHPLGCLALASRARKAAACLRVLVPEFVTEATRRQEGHG